MNAARVVAPPPPSAVSRRRAAWYARAACVVALVLVVVVGANNWGTESNFLHTSPEIPSWRTNSTATTGDRDTEAHHQKPRLGVATATAAASLRTMRNECVATFGHPAPVGLTNVPSSPASPTVVPNNVVCVHRNKLYVDMEEATADVDVSATSIGVKKSRGNPPSSRPRRFEQDANVFSDTSLENFLAARGGNTAVHPPIFHSNSFAIVLSALWNSVNFFHMLMDGLVPAMYWIETTLPLLHDNHHSDAQQHSDDANRPTSSLDLKVVHMGDKKFLYTDNKKSLCTTCVAYSARAMVMAKNASSLEATIGNAVVGDVVVDRAIVADGSPASTTLLASSSSSSSSSSSAVRFSDEELHCFCGAAVFGMNRLAKFSKERELGITAFRHRLVRSYGELAYGLAPRVEHYTRLGFWAGNKSTVGMPRLLLVNRNRRRIGNFDKIEVMAKEIGFNVATVYFENMAPDAQFHLSRYADVLVGIHGMALTFVANMDGEFRGVSDHESTGTASVATSSCKTLVELMHWINPTKFYIYREMAQLSGVAFSRLLPTSVSFGSSVENPAKEKVLLQKRNYYWWSLKGFDDQTVVFHEGQVRDVLLEAYQRAKRCSPV